MLRKVFQLLLVLIRPMKLNRYISPFRLVAVLLYTGVIISKFVRELTDTCDKPVSFNNEFIFLAILFILIGLEFYEQRRYPIRPPFRASVALLVVRVCSNRSCENGRLLVFYAFLYLIPPLISFRYFSRPIGIVIAVIAFANYTTQQYLLWGFVDSLDEVLIFTLGLTFGIAMLNLLEQEERNRERAEQLLNELEASQQQVVELAAAEERNRLARNIHDSVGHYLTVVGIQLDKAMAYKAIDPQQSDKPS